MGGQNEQTLDGGIRAHESGGEIHFHDDANKVKCSVPKLDYETQWDRLSKGIVQDVEFKDKATGSGLKLSRITTQGNVVDINVSLKQQTKIFGDTFMKLKNLIGQ